MALLEGGHFVPAFAGNARCRVGIFVRHLAQNPKMADTFSGVILVMQANGGNRTVPTLLFRDGTALTNPSIDQVKSQLTLLPEE